MEARAVNPSLLLFESSSIMYPIKIILMIFFMLYFLCVNIYLRCSKYGVKSLIDLFHLEQIISF
ncbi:conserved hypothetical protein [Listeria monocytogenes HPB2262]|nr:hypothetical protein LMOh7858_1770 [Listeria monocytogenes str. 4b H7858] [Listeria monocytogenes serotype 4b str. H7858]EFF95180.1 conserved hypothetical protein [Listeria monocytogenes HPB2262]EFG01281.1 conserved hypothetical protein [Listeria monocytogenes FSL J1-194]